MLVWSFCLCVCICVGDYSLGCAEVCAQCLLHSLLEDFVYCSLISTTALLFSFFLSDLLNANYNCRSSPFPFLVALLLLLLLPLFFVDDSMIVAIAKCGRRRQVQARSNYDQQSDGESTACLLACLPVFAVQVALSYARCLQEEIQFDEKREGERVLH